jgi:hypothetical protein
VAADVVEGAQLAVVTAHHDDVLSRHVRYEVISGCRGILDAAGQQPVPPKPGGPLEREYFRIVIDAARQGAGRERRPSRGLDFGWVDRRME